MWELTSEQLILADWIMFYVSIYEMPNDDRPHEWVIESDDELDLWLKRYSEKNRRR